MFSVIVTVKNESDSIESLLESLIKQTLRPKEIIIVDAGSTDDTVKIIEEFAPNLKNKTEISVLKFDNINRSQGRNIGIQKAKEEYMAVTDAGCEADKNWLAQFKKSFIDENAEAVAGFYTPIGKDAYSEVFGWFLAVDPSKFDDTFLPSARSLAFTRKAWEAAGKFPEHLNTCEDLIFAQSLEEKTVMVRNPKALVRWQLPKDIRAYIKSVSGYAEGDILAGYNRHVLKIATIYLRYLIMLAWPPLIFLYLIFILGKFHHKLRSLNHVILVLLTQFITDIAVIAGSLRGLAKRTLIN